MIEDHEQLTKQTDKAIQFLAETDSEHASLKANLSSLQELKKTVFSYGFLDAEGGAELRKAHAHTTKEYIDHIASIKDTEMEYQELHNKRQRAMATIELYRTMSANQRRGNI